MSIVYPFSHLFRATSASHLSIVSLSLPIPLMLHFVSLSLNPFGYFLSPGNLERGMSCISSPTCTIPFCSILYALPNKASLTPLRHAPCAVQEYSAYVHLLCRIIKFSSTVQRVQGEQREHIRVDFSWGPTRQLANSWRIQP